MLYGPPGTGKSSIAECVATETGRRFYQLIAGSIVNSYQGSGSVTITKLFEHIRAQNFPTVLFIDEIDSIINNKQQDGNREDSKAKVVLQGELDKKDPRIVCLFATNYPDNLHAEILSRFKKIEIPLPSEDIRFQLFKYYSANRKTKVDDNFFKAIAKQTKDLSCRDIEEIVEEASAIELERNQASIDNMFINECDYIIAASEYILVPLKPATRKLLFKYYINQKELNIDLIPSLLDILTKESKDLSALDIEKAVNSAYVLIKVKENIVELDAFYAGIYYDQKTKFAELDIREKIIRYFFKRNNIEFDKEIYEDLARYTEFENFTGKELEAIVDNTILSSEERDDNKKILEEDAYIGLYQELKKKALATEVSKTINVDVKTRIGFNLSIYAGFNWSPACLDYHENISTEDFRTLAQNEEFLKKTSIGDRITRSTRLDFVNQNYPLVKARANLIKYFLSQIKHKLTDDEITEFIVKSKGLSWHSLEESIKDTSIIAHTIDGACFMEYKHLRYMLGTNYNILLEENPNKPEKVNLENFEKEEKEKEHEMKAKPSSRCLLM